MALWTYMVLGLVSGVFSSTFGVGAGIILVPSLVFFMNLPQKSAQGVALAVMVPMALTGALRYWLNPDILVDLKTVGLLAAFGVLGALAGSTIAAHASPLVLRRLFAVIMVVAAVRMFLKT